MGFAPTERPCLCTAHRKDGLAVPASTADFAASAAGLILGALAAVTPGMWLTIATTALSLGLSLAQFSAVHPPKRDPNGNSGNKALQSYSFNGIVNTTTEGASQSRSYSEGSGRAASLFRTTNTALRRTRHRCQCNDRLPPKRPQPATPVQGAARGFSCPTRCFRKCRQLAPLHSCGVSQHRARLARAFVCGQSRPKCSVEIR